MTVINIAVIGSRGYPSLEKVDAYLESLLKNLDLFRANIKIVTGGANGVDKRVEEWCRLHSVACEVIRPLNKADKMSYLFRNIEIITLADYVIAFWDGQSKGTKFVIDYAKGRNKNLIQL